MNVKRNQQKINLMNEIEPVLLRKTNQSIMIEKELKKGKTFITTKKERISCLERGYHNS